MPCVSISNNNARKASVKALNLERKNNRENTRLAKKQQSDASKSAKVAAKSAKLATKSAETQAKSQAKADAKALKTRQSLEKRVTKKHQAHRAKVKTARVKAAKTEAKLAAKTAKVTAKSAKLAAKTATMTAKTASKTAAKAARSQAKSNLKATRLATRVARTQKLKTSIKKPAKILKSSLETAKKSLKTRQDTKKAQKTARAQARAQTKARAKAQRTQSSAPQTSAEASRVAKISGASVQNSFKIPHTSSRASAYAPKPLRRTAFMTRGDLINAESRLGSTIFGPVPAGHRREFFHDQDNIWIWFESWHDETAHPRQLTVRYEVRPSGVYKKISAGAYFKLAGDELENFRRATHAYLHLVKKYLYQRETA